MLFDNKNEIWRYYTLYSLRFVTWHIKLIVNNEIIIVLCLWRNTLFYIYRQSTYQVIAMKQFQTENSLFTVQDVIESVQYPFFLNCRILQKLIQLTNQQMFIIYDFSCIMYSFKTKILQSWWRIALFIYIKIFILIVNHFKWNAINDINNINILTSAY